MELGLAQAFNRRHLAQRPGDANLTARIRSFETAFGMQAEAPEAFNLAQETDATLRLYGLPRGSTRGFAWQCLVARRLAERGVRFMELIDTGASNNWDSHGDMNDHAPLAQNVDQPIAALLKDLKRRGMLEETLVVWTTEFGRTPFNTGQGRAGPRASCGGVRLMDGRRRRQRGLQLRRQRRLRLHRGVGRSPYSRFPRDDSPFAWPRSREADLPPRRA